MQYPQPTGYVAQPTPRDYEEQEYARALECGRINRENALRRDEWVRGQLAAVQPSGEPVNRTPAPLHTVPAPGVVEPVTFEQFAQHIRTQRVIKRANARPVKRISYGQPRTTFKLGE